MANPRIRFVGGSSGLYWLGWSLVSLLTFVAAMLVIAQLSGDTRRPPIRVFVGIGVAIAIGGALIKQGRTKPYDPRDPPAALLPAS